MSAGMETSADELNTIDGQLGDGDLGVTLVRGARGLMKVKDDLPEDLGLAMLKCAQALTKESGSSYGTLIATAFMAAAKDSKSKTERPWSDISPLLRLAVSAMLKRGKGHLGAKTVVDAVHVVAEKLDGINEPRVVLAAAREAVAEALETFRDKPCQLGRARIFSEKSVGLDDPGMVAFQRILDSLA
ncbi:MAG: dihydroxyacetone kinase subunit L [Dehalococcoidia bacterium]|nr:dihydroxyacetone kinase subunit L [Dehalococcoidia bacterium]